MLNLIACLNYFNYQIFYFFMKLLCGVVNFDISLEEIELIVIIHLYFGYGKQFYPFFSGFTNIYKHIIPFL